MLDPLTLLPAVSPYLRFSGDQECYYEEDLRILSSMSKKEHMKGNETMLDFRTSKFVLRISRDSYQVSSLGETRNVKVSVAVDNNVSYVILPATEEAPAGTSEQPDLEYYTGTSLY